MSFYENSKYNIKTISTILIIFTSAYVFFQFILGYVWPFVIAIILSSLLEPVVSFLNKVTKLSRGVSGLISIIFLIFIIAFIGTELIFKINEEVSMLARSMDPSYIENLIQEMKNNLIPLNLPFGEDIYTFLINNIPKLFTPTQYEFKIVSSVSRFLIGLVVCFISTFFFIKDRTLIRNWVKKTLIRLNLKNVLLIKEGLVVALLAYVKAQLILMCITACICLIGFNYINLPYAIVGSFVVAFVDAIPILGSGLFLFPAIIYNFIMNDYSKVIILAVIYLAIFLSRQVIEPKIISNKIGVHPLVTIISIYVGLKLFGVLGFIIGPIIVITMKTISDMTT